MTDTRRNLIKLLTFVQNGLSTSIDIMTITGFMDDAEVAKHLMTYAKQLSPERRAALLEMARNLNA